MAYEIQVTATNIAVTSSSTEFAVTVNSPAQPNFTITNAVSTVTINQLFTTSSIYTDAVELVLGTLNDVWRGTWSSTSTYIRGDIVDYQYSQYFLTNFDIDPTAVYGPTATPPSQDPTWIRFNWHEAPFAVLTVTNSATFFGPIYANNSVEFNGGINANSAFTVAGTSNFNGVANFNNTLNSNNQLIATTATFNTATIKLARIDDLLLGGGAEGQGLTVNSTATFNGRVNLNNTTTVNGPLIFSTSSQLVVANLTVTNELQVGERFVYNGLEYPKDKGLFGQVLYTNGSTKADWVNLGELTFWSLSNDLYTNGFDIYTNSLGQDLGIGVSTTNTFVASPSYAKFFANGDLTLKSTRNISMEGSTRLTVDSTTATFSFTTATIRAQQGIRIGGGIPWYLAPIDITGNRLTLAGAPYFGLPGFFRYDGISYRGGLQVDGSDTYVGNESKTTISAGPVKGALDGNAYISLEKFALSENIAINGDTQLLNSSTFTLSSAGITFFDGTTQTSAALTTATVVAGVGIDINYGTPNTTISLKTATNTILGGIKVGSGLQVLSDGTLNVNGGEGGAVTSISAGTGTFVSTSSGAVTVWIQPVTTNTFSAGTGTAVTINTVTNDVTYRVIPATSSTLGGIIVGEGLNVNQNGVISASSTATMGNINLTEDMRTNGFDIKHSSAYANSKLTVSTTTVALQALGRTSVVSKLLLGDLNDTEANVISLTRGDDIVVDFRNITGYPTYRTPGYTARINSFANNYIEVDNGSSKLRLTNTATIIANDGITLAVSNGQANIEANLTNIKSTATILGTTVNNSTLRVERIYNYNGTFAPFFPAGVQFQDNTVQFTAFQPDQGLL